MGIDPFSAPLCSAQSVLDAQARTKAALQKYEDEIHTRS